jgi:hypothetical protein
MIAKVQAQSIHHQSRATDMQEGLGYSSLICGAPNDRVIKLLSLYIIN